MRKIILVCLGLFFRPTEAKDLVLGCAMGYGEDKLSVLINSIRNTSQETDIALITDVQTFSVNQFFFQKNRIIPLFFETSRWISTQIHYARFAKCLDYVLEHPEYERIFLTDTRDVVFQQNLFSLTPDTTDFLWLFEESFAIGDIDSTQKPNINYTWMQIHYGEAVAEQLKDKPVQCCGTVVGSKAYIIEYLFKMINAKDKNYLFLASLQLGEKSMYNLMDQTIQNYLYYTGQLPFAEAKKNGDIVATTSSLGRRFDENWVEIRGRDFSKEGIELKDGELYMNGQKAVVVHQYDRFPELREFFEQKWK